MSEVLFKSDVLPVEYRGERGFLPVVTNPLDMHEFVETRLQPGLEKLRSEVADELVEYAGYAVGNYTVPEDRWVNRFPETAEALAGALVLTGAAVNRKTNSYTQSFFIGWDKCLDNMGRRAFDWVTYDHRGVYPQTSFTDRVGWIVGPVVRTNEENGKYAPNPTDQYEEILFNAQHAVYIPGTVALSFLIDKYPALGAGYGVGERMIAKLFTEDFGLVAADSTFDSWMVGLELHNVCKAGLEPYEKE